MKNPSIPKDMNFERMDTGGHFKDLILPIRRIDKDRWEVFVQKINGQEWSPYMPSFSRAIEKNYQEWCIEKYLLGDKNEN